MVVTEGFAGNIALKTAEGTARQIAALSPRGGERVAAGAHRLPARQRRLRASSARTLDPRRANGGVFLGLNGIVIKSHGGTDAEGFAAAIEIGYSMARTTASWTDQPGPRGLSRAQPVAERDAAVAKTGAM